MLMQIFIQQCTVGGYNFVNGRNRADPNFFYHVMFSETVLKNNGELNRYNCLLVEY